MRMGKNLGLIVLVNSILIVSAEDFNPERIVGKWNIVGIVHNLPKNAKMAEQCTTLTYEKLSDDIYKQTRELWNLADKHIITMMIVRIVGSKITEIPTLQKEPTEMTVLDWSDDKEIVLYVQGKNTYLVNSRDLEISSEVLTKYQQFSKWGWTLAAVPHHKCQQLKDGSKQ